MICDPLSSCASYLLELSLFYFGIKLRLALGVNYIVGEGIRGNESCVLDLGKVEKVAAECGEGEVAAAGEDDQEESEGETDSWDREEQYLQFFWFPFLCYISRASLTVVPLRWEIEKGLRAV